MVKYMVCYISNRHFRHAAGMLDYNYKTDKYDQVLLLTCC